MVASSPVETATGALAGAWNPKKPLIAYLIQEPASDEPKPRRNRLAFVDLSGRPRLDGDSAGSEFRERSPRVGAGRRAAARRSRQAAALPAELYVVDPRSPDPYRLVFRAAVGEQIRGAAWAADGSTIVLGLERARSDIVLLSAD